MIYIIYVDGELWHFGSSVNIRQRFKDHLGRIEGECCPHVPVIALAAWEYPTEAAMLTAEKAWHEALGTAWTNLDESRLQRARAA